MEDNLRSQQEMSAFNPQHRGNRLKTQHRYHSSMGTCLLHDDMSTAVFTEITLVDPEMPAAQKLAAPHCQLDLLRLKKNSFCSFLKSCGLEKKR